jgi:hypothetical protein
MGRPTTQFNFKNPSSLFHDPLLFSEPTFKGDPFGEVGVLQLTLTSHLLRTWDAGSDFEKAHTNEKNGVQSSQTC